MRKPGYSLCLYLIILTMAMAASAGAGASTVLIEDFENFSAHAIVQQSDNWLGSLAAVVEPEPGNPGDHVLKHRLSAAQHDLHRRIAKPAAIGQTQTSTLFFRFRCSNQWVDTGIGLTNVDTPSGWDDFRVQIQINNGQLGVRHGGQTIYTESLQMGTNAATAWYNVWLVVDNSSNTYKVYLVQSDSDLIGATEADRITSGPINTFDFRQPSEAALNRLYLRANTNNDLWVDQIHMIQGEHLDNPIWAPSARLWHDAIANTQAGGIAQLEANDYILHETLIINKPIQIVGQGKHHTSIIATDDFTGDMVQISNTDNVQLADFTLDGNSNPNVNAGIRLTNGTGHLIERLKIQDFARSGNSYTAGPYGINCSNVSHSSFVDNDILNIGPSADWGAGIRLRHGSNNNIIDGNVIDGVGRGGIFTNDGSTNTRITNNVVQNVSPFYPAFGIEVWGTAEGKQAGLTSNVVIEDNVVDYWISIDKHENVAVRRNEIVGPAQGSFIGFYALEMVWSQNVVMTDNSVNGRHHLGLSTSSSGAEDLLFFARNTISNAQTWGAQIQGDVGGAHRMYFYDNVFELTKKTSESMYPSSAGHGFRFNDNAFGFVFNENTFRNNAGSGIQLFGGNLDNFVVINNTITNNAGQSIVGNFPGENLYASGNVASGNGVLWSPNRNRTLHNETKGNPYNVPGDIEIIVSGQLVAGRPISFELAGFDQVELSAVLWDMAEGFPTVGEHIEHVYGTAGQFQVAAVAWLADSNYGILVETTVEIAEEPILIADINSDGVVDVLDFAILGQQWMTSGNIEPSADLNNDGWVDIKDVLILTEQWLETFE